MKAIKQPVPCRVTAHMATAGLFRTHKLPERSAAAIRFAANGAITRRGYAGKTHVGVIVWTGNTLVSKG
jgi:hypothetical protein